MTRLGGRGLGGARLGARGGEDAQPLVIAPTLTARLRSALGMLVESVHALGARAAAGLGLEVAHQVTARAGLVHEVDLVLAGVARGSAALASEVAVEAVARAAVGVQADPSLLVAGRAAPSLVAVDPSLPVTGRAAPVLVADVGPFAASARGNVGFEAAPTGAVLARAAAALVEADVALPVTARGSPGLAADPTLLATGRAALGIQADPQLAAAPRGSVAVATVDPVLGAVGRGGVAVQADVDLAMTGKATPALGSTDPILEATGRASGALGGVDPSLPATARAAPAVAPEVTLLGQARGALAWAVEATHSLLGRAATATQADPTVEATARSGAALASADPALAATGRATGAMGSADPTLSATHRATPALAADPTGTAQARAAATLADVDPYPAATVRATISVGEVGPVHQVTGRGAVAALVEAVQGLAHRAVASLTEVHPSLTATHRGTQALVADVGPLGVTGKAEAALGVGLDASPRAAVALVGADPHPAATARALQALLVDPVHATTARGAAAAQADAVVVGGKYGKARSRPGNTLRITIGPLIASKDACWTNPVNCIGAVTHNVSPLHIKDDGLGSLERAIVGWDLAGLPVPTNSALTVVAVTVDLTVQGSTGADDQDAWTIDAANEGWTEATINCAGQPAMRSNVATGTSGATHRYVLSQVGRDACAARMGVGSFSLIFDTGPLVGETTYKDRTVSGEEPLLTIDCEVLTYRTATFDPTKDCKVEVQEDCGPDQNLNGEELAVSDGTTLDLRTYIAFTLTGLPADPIIDRAELRLHFLETDVAQTVNVHSIAEVDENWGETAIKCSNHPSSTDILGTITLPTGTGTAWVTLPQGVRDYLRDRAGDSDVTLLLTMATANETRTFRRREAPTSSERPQLKVWYYG
jgi:hypothetical protein